MTGDSAPTSPSPCAARVPRTGAEVFTMTDPGVHDADPGVHDADPGVHDADPGVHDADPGVHDADLAVHDGPIRAFTMDRFSHVERALGRLDAERPAQDIQARGPERPAGLEQAVEVEVRAQLIGLAEQIDPRRHAEQQAPGDQEGHVEVAARRIWGLRRQLVAVDCGWFAGAATAPVDGSSAGDPSRS